MKCCQGLVAVSTILLSLGVSCLVHADLWISYPGTKARAMGGAFTAVADDASAVWYNPGGILENGRSNVTFEVSNRPSLEDDGTYSGKERNIFGSVAFLARDKNGAPKWAVSLYYTEPYSLSINVDTPEFIGTLVEDLKILGLGFTFRILNLPKNVVFPRITLGATGEAVFLDAMESNLVYKPGNIPLNDFSNENNGYSGSVGMMFTLLETKFQESSVANWTLNLGGVYRFKSNIDSKNESGIISAFKEIAFQKPPSWDIGLALSKTLFGTHRLTFSGQYGEVDYGKNTELFALKYQKTSIGGEYQINRSEEKFFEQFAFRGGLYHSKTDPGEESGQQSDLFPDVDGFTAGLGLGIGKWNLEFAYEKRQLKYLLDPEEIGLWMFSLRYAW